MEQEFSLAFKEFLNFSKENLYWYQKHIESKFVRQYLAPQPTKLVEMDDRCFLGEEELQPEDCIVKARRGCHEVLLTSAYAESVKTPQVDLKDPLKKERKKKIGADAIRKEIPWISK